MLVAKYEKGTEHQPQASVVVEGHLGELSISS